MSTLRRKDGQGGREMKIERMTEIETSDIEVGDAECELVEEGV